jgi:hypothetical protein
MGMKCPFCDLDEKFHIVEGDKLRCQPDRQQGFIKACLALAAGEYQPERSEA